MVPGGAGLGLSPNRIMSVIVTENLTKRYGSRVGIDGLSLTVPAGAVFGFLGPNGSGKTTTIRLLLALLRPTGGRASIFGLDCWRNSPTIKADVGYVPGDLRLYAWMNARNALRVLGQVRGRNLITTGAEFAEQFGLDMDVRVGNMSRGMRQKLGLILALVHRPQLLILDEPTSALDPLMQQRLYEHLRERAAQGATVFFSSHTLSEVEDLCDHVVILRDGKLVAADTLEALRKRARREVTLRWKDEVAARDQVAPSFLEVHERRGREWHCTLVGPVMELVRWSATQSLGDFAIGPPDLESLFRQFYQQDESPA